MGNFNWINLVAKYSDEELKKVYSNRSYESQEKVAAVISELKRRNLITANENVIVLKGEIFENKNIKNTKPNDKISKAAQFFIWVFLGVQITYLMALIFRYSILYRLSHGQNVSDRNLNNQIFAIIQVLLKTVYVFSGITFIVWFKRAYSNLEKRTGGLRFSNIWAVISWFVPILFLYYPYQMMKELKIRTNMILSERFNKKFIPDVKTIKYWWFLWLVTKISVGILYKISPETTTGFIYMTYANIMETMTEIVLALITIKMIRAHTNDENKLYETEIRNNVQKQHRF